MLNLYKLHIFATVAQEGSFSAAATTLYMSQSAISQHMRDLENSLGTTLFNRGRRGVKLTFAGEKLFDYTQRILQLVAEAENAITHVENLREGQIRIAATPVISVYLLPQWTRRFREQYPHLVVALTTDITSQVIQSVVSHRVELGFVEGEIEIPVPHLGQIVLQTIPMAVVVNATHAWAERDTIPIHLLDKQPLVSREANSHTRLWMENLARYHQITFHIVAEFDNPESIKQAVASGMGLTILPVDSIQDEVSRGRLKAIQIEQVPLERTLKLLWDEARFFNPITRTFIKIMTDFFPQLKRLVE